ncbi:MAG: putative hydroxymethylpyrimidine transporter CytX, partial [Pseudomonadota bacterium]
MESAATTYDPLTPVPARRRVFSGSDAFALWFSLGIGLLVLQAGALLVP